MSFPRWLRALVPVFVMMVAAGQASAARLRYHYQPAPCPGPALSCAGGERLTLRGWEPYGNPPPPATCLATFKHPATGQCITLPLALPPSTPNMEYRTNRVIYNYGSYTVEVHFLADGTADVIYNSGLQRAP
jgi:hypothetical protein